jgi:phosphate starvation-inducible PhoH-like protein
LNLKDTDYLKEGESNQEVLTEFPDNRLLIDLCGEFDRNIVHIESALTVNIIRRGNQLVTTGEFRLEATRVLQAMYQRLEAKKDLESSDIDAEIRMLSGNTNGGAIRIKSWFLE